MEIAMIGLGKMGANMALRLLRAGPDVVGFDPRREAVEAHAAAGGRGANSLEEARDLLSQARVFWVMVPSGGITQETILKLADISDAGDIIIDGGNSFYKDSWMRADEIRKRDRRFVDVGTSGGIWGLEQGYSMMVRGETEVVDHLRPVLETLAPAPDQGWGHVGPAAAGHFVKMIHNGIEYGLMQAYAEGFSLLEKKTEMSLDLHQVAEIWRYGSVVRSWLLDLTARALEENPGLEGIAAYVPDSGEGRWTVLEAIELNCSIPVISMALERRFRSREAAPFGDKLLSAMRNQFGGHAVKRT
jgi:6-phosphogluconate dehydrogenase